MGKPSKPEKVDAAKVNETYNWGDFGSANAGGISLSPTASQNVTTAQSGINQYLNELINPSYSSESFRARQELLDQSNQQYANQLAANAIARGARGSATQNILNSIAANRNNDMRNAMTQEDTRVQNILSALSGIEGNYFNQSSIMGNNILQRAMQNQAAENAARQFNSQLENAYRSSVDKWKQGIYQSIGEAAGSAIGGMFGGPMGAYAGGQAGSTLGGAGQGASDYGSLWRKTGY